MDTSPASVVRELYQSSVESYAQMMDSEIELPVYGEILSRLNARISVIDGGLLDSSCGTGHLLELFHKQCAPSRELAGIDLSPAMVENARARLGQKASVQAGDMRNLSGFAPTSLSAVLSFFAIHHLGPGEMLPTFEEWSRVLKVGGQIVIGAWEGSGQIDYGESSDVIALRYKTKELSNWLEVAGFKVDRCWVEDVDGFSMDAVYLEGSKL